MKARTQAMLETAQFCGAGLLGGAGAATMIYFLGVEIFSVVGLIALCCYLIYMIYMNNLERISTERRVRNERLIRQIETSDQ